MKVKHSFRLPAPWKPIHVVHSTISIIRIEKVSDTNRTPYIRNRVLRPDIIKTLPERCSAAMLQRIEIRFAEEQPYRQQQR